MKSAQLFKPSCAYPSRFHNYDVSHQILTYFFWYLWEDFQQIPIFSWMKFYSLKHVLHRKQLYGIYFKRIVIFRENFLTVVLMEVFFHSPVLLFSAFFFFQFQLLSITAFIGNLHILFSGYPCLDPTAKRLIRTVLLANKTISYNSCQYKWYYIYLVSRLLR